MSLGKALEAFRSGNAILLFDSEEREGETDFAMPALAVRPADVARMRRDGGGLICVAVPAGTAERMGLPFMSDVLRRAFIPAGIVEREGDLAYDSRSSFSLWVNHRATFTGITDNDRALTINKIGEAACGKADFAREFRSPGHVAILRAAGRLLKERRGQTELSVALAQMAGVCPAMAICEMLDSETGRALSKEKAKAYGARHGLPFVEGRDVLDAAR